MKVCDCTANETCAECAPPSSALSIQVGGDHYKKLAIQPMEYSMANKLDACQHYAQRLREGLEQIVSTKCTAGDSVSMFARSLLAIPHDTSALDALVKDAERLKWIESLFERKWNGVVGSGCAYQWQLVGNYRHEVVKMQGETFDAAIDEAMKEE